ncbi:AbrB family transcriptional regulator [Acaryochloris marina]|uniref:AbrB family transcriptional regulator n=1 Tax=Acaryochloris marina TaxID=155978 RepID=UPI001BAE99CD|nr:AbrB family transcriptional regulator [Acaryochloris marina]QUY45846.1 AbrB family transcriptional regulator [Acaryochloris marina S15]
MAKKRVAAKKQDIQPLVGKELLSKLKDLSHLSKREKAKECGYVVGKQVNLSGFMNAILEAKGISLDGDANSDSRGREASYRIKVHQNGQMVIGSAYTEKMGVQTGDEFEIKVGRKHIHLTQLTEDE